ncbi:hypothetical protein CVIRNUC_004289 [Coccomyxa viridis]|uniref:Uncharacterized protein n=1 Tax=Coccomyxa viridis TaxID=1274662 RepID=A0AAV1I5B1_9CHLO|nr:hypothetical protein CVIRNUC_004289 [Coccomyxa viridis]
MIGLRTLSGVNHLKNPRSFLAQAIPIWNQQATKCLRNSLSHMLICPAQVQHVPAPFASSVPGSAPATATGRTCHQR